MEKEEMNVKIAEFEKEISNVRIKLKALNERLKNTYEYKDHLILAQVKADEEIKHLQSMVYEASNTIPDLVNDMKKLFQLYTSNL